MSSPTHRLVEKPRISVRFLADYMAASKRGERSILLNSKYRSLARLIQHDEAQSTVSKFIRDGDKDVSWLEEEAARLRGRLVDDDFDRDLFDNNADYIARFATIARKLELPKADILTPGPREVIMLNGVAVTVGLHMRFRRVTRTNKVKEGAGMLRYAKGKRLSPTAAAWQSAFILGFLRDTSVDQSVEPEQQLCLTVDAYVGVCHAAPGDSVRRYADMKAACASIAEQWPNIKATPKMIFGA